MREIDDSAAYCPYCGAPTGEKRDNDSMLTTIAQIFMVIGCVAGAPLLLPLCWSIPMTVSYFRRVKERRPIGIGFKVCTLLFVSLVAGIMMLCDGDN